MNRLLVALRAVHGRRPETTAQSGQVMILFAIMAVVVTGVIALAIDVGFAYHQRQNHQNMASNAAEAGAYQVYDFNRYGTPTGGSAAADAQVLAAMEGVLAANGVTVHLTQPANNDACAANYSPSDVYLQAAYTDSSLSSSIQVGSGVYDPNATGITVQALSGCAPAFFARVLGRQNFSVGANEQAGQISTSSSGSGSVASIPVTNGGSGYSPSSPPAVTLSAPTGSGGTQATASAIVSGEVTGITISSAGSGYSVGEALTLTGGGGSGASATVTSVNSSGAITGIQINSGGLGYTSAPSVAITGGTGASATVTSVNGSGGITGITISSAGSGYSVGQILPFTGSGGASATVTSVNSSGGITGITISSAGSGYSAGQTLPFTGSGSGATLTAAESGVVVAISVTNGGSGYTSPPSVTIGAPGSGGTQAVATADLGSSGSGSGDSAADTPIPTVTGTIVGPGYGSATGTPTSTVLPTLTATPTATATATTIPSATSTTPTATPTVDTSQQFNNSGFMVYALPSPMLYAVGAPHYPAGDTVTMFANSGTWAADQYANQSQGLSGNPGGITVHDSSMEGCTNTAQTTFTVGGVVDFNHGGVGHCASAPNVGDIVTLPLVYEVNKNDGSCSANGGYCEIATAVVNVKVTVSNKQHGVQGQIVGVVYDPYHVVELPPVPTPTVTASLTPTQTMTPTPTATATKAPPLP